MKVGSQSGGNCSCQSNNVWKAGTGRGEQRQAYLGSLLINQNWVVEVRGKGKGSVKDDPQVPGLGTKLVGDHVPDGLNPSPAACSASSALASRPSKWRC